MTRRTTARTPAARPGRGTSATAAVTTAATALALVAGLAVAGPAGAAPAPAAAASEQAAAKTQPVVVVTATPPQLVEDSPFVVTVRLAAGVAGAPAPTGFVTFHDAVRPYSLPVQIATPPLGVRKLVPVPGEQGVASATFPVKGLTQLHDVAVTYGGDTRYTAVPKTAPAFADAEIVFGGALGQARQLLQRLYYDVLDRRPDTAGFNYWLPGVKAGQYADASYAFAISAERLQGEIEDAYQAYFGHAADAAGLALYTKQMQEGLTVQGLQVALAKSKEFSDTYGGDNAVVVEALYRGILGRAADPAGKAYYRDLLDSGALTRAQVAAELANSDSALRPIVVGLYAEVLERQADADGLVYWIGAIRGGYRQELVSFSMTLSDEYLTHLAP